MLKFLHVAVAVMVTVYAAFAVDDAVSKKTSSVFVGTDAPLAPQDVALQCVVPAASQFPVPPTQYLFAMVIVR